MFFHNPFLLELSWEKHKFRINDTIKMVLKTVVHDGVDWIHMAQDRCQRLDIVNKMIRF